MSVHPLVLSGQYGSPYMLKMRAVLRYQALAGDDRDRVDATRSGTGCEVLFA